MKSRYIPPAPKGFIERIAAKLGYSKTIPSGLGNDLVDAVTTLDDQKANQGTIAKVCNDSTAPTGGIPANSFFYHNGILCFTPTLIAQGATIPSGLEVPNGGLNEIYKATTTTLTPSEGFLISVNDVAKTGRIVQVSFSGRFTSQNPNWTSLGTCIYHPLIRSYFFVVSDSDASVNYLGVINTSGTIQIWNPPLNTTLEGYITYISQ